MGYLDSMKMIGRTNKYSIGLIDEKTYDPASADNVFVYKMFHADANYNDYQYLLKIGVFVNVVYLGVPGRQE